MRDIRRPDSSEPVVERLTSAHGDKGMNPIFPTIMDLLIFCAGVGFVKNKRSQVPASGKAIPIRIFENNQKEGYIYLLALAEMKDSSVLTPDNEDDAARIFEEYAAGGLEEVESWLKENAMDSTGIQALIANIQLQLPRLATPTQDPNPI